MKRIFIIAVILLCGVGVLAYPAVSNYLMERNGSYIINEYEAQLESTDDADIEVKWNEAVEYNKTLSGGPACDPFNERNDAEVNGNYDHILNIQEVMAYIVIPKIDIQLPIFHGTSEEALQKGVGHLEGSSLPIGGEGTHAVIAGHTGLSGAKIFTDLEKLEEGDLFYIHILGRVLTYRTDQIKVVEPEDTKDLMPEAGKDYVTLLTCTPYGMNSHRLLVRGVRTEYVPEEEAKAKSSIAPSGADRTVTEAAAITSSVMLLLIIIAIVISRVGNRRCSR